MSNATRRGINWNDADKQIMETHNLTRSEVRMLRQAQQPRQPGVIRRWLNRMFNSSTPQPSEARPSVEVLRERVAATSAPATTEPAGAPETTLDLPEVTPAAATPANQLTPASPERVGSLLPKDVNWGAVTLKMWEQKSNAELGRFLNTRRQNVRAYRLANNLPDNPASSTAGSKWDRITPEMWRAKTDEEIAELLRVKPVTAKRRRTARNQTTRRSRIDWDQLTLEDWASLTNPQIAELTGAGLSTIENRRSRLRLPPSPRVPLEATEEATAAAEPATTEVEVTAEPETAEAEAIHPETQTTAPEVESTTETASEPSVEAQFNWDIGEPGDYNWDALTEEQWAGFSDGQIAAHVGCTRQAVNYQRTKRYPKDKPAKPNPAYDWASVTTEMWETFTNREIGDYLGGAHRTVVAKHRKKHGQARRQTTTPAATPEAPVENKTPEPEKTSSPNLTDLFGAHPTTITRSVKKAPARHK